jgi:hypothetical protein
MLVGLPRVFVVVRGLVCAIAGLCACRTKQLNLLCRHWGYYSTHCGVSASVYWAPNGVQAVLLGDANLAVMAMTPMGATDVTTHALHDTSSSSSNA